MDEWVNVLFIVVMAVLWAVGALVKGAGAKSRRQGGQGQTKQPQRRRETWQQRLARKAEEVQRAAEERSRQAAERMRKFEEKARRQQAGRRDTQRSEPARPTRIPEGRVTVRPGRAGESVMVYEPGQRPPSGRRGDLATQQRQAREAVSAARRRPAARRAREETPMPAKPPLQVEPAADTLPMPALTLAAPKPLQPDRGLPGAGDRPKSFEAGTILDYSDPDALKKAILHYEILGRPLALRDPLEQSTTL